VLRTLKSVLKYWQATQKTERKSESESEIAMCDRMQMYNIMNSHLIAITLFLCINNYGVMCWQTCFFFIFILSTWPLLTEIQTISAILSQQSEVTTCWTYLSLSFAPWCSLSIVWVTYSNSWSFLNSWWCMSFLKWDIVCHTLFKHV
jgi:hypothetical protein